MPDEAAPQTPLPQLQPSRSNLRFKVSALIVLVALIPPTLQGFFTFHTLYLPFYPLSILIAAIGLGLVWSSLRADKDSQPMSVPNTPHDGAIQAVNQTIQNPSEESTPSPDENLSRDKTKLNTIISSLTEGVIVLDTNRKVVLANVAAEAVTGITFQEMAEKGVDELFTISDKVGTPIASSTYAPVSEGGEVVLRYETTSIVSLTNKKGEKHDIRLVGSPILGKAQSDLGCILLLHDASPEKELESIQLDFVSMASHELRTPLTSILGYISVFLDDYKEKLNKEQKESLDRIMICAQQLNALIDNLLSVSKVERGAFSINTTPIDWKELLKKIVQDNQLQAIQKNLTLKLNLPDEELPKMNVDPVRITEVINNLIGNAINYTQSGGSITVTTKKDKSELVTSIKDTGVGIPKEALSHLFTKFFRVSGALDQSSNSKGTGLGLYISKSVVDLHKGKIWAESEPGKGSTFSFSLPLTGA